MGIEYDVGWSPIAREGFSYWIKNDRKTAAKILEMIEEIVRYNKHGDNPLSGTGQPEYLKGDKDGTISRRINQKERLLYTIEDGKIIIASCRGHYGDK